MGAGSCRNWFIPTPETIRAMLLDVGFSELECITEVNNRAILTARKSGSPENLTPRWLEAGIVPSVDTLSARPGETIDLGVTVENRGIAKWLHQGIGDGSSGAVRICAQLTSAADELYVRRLPWVELAGEVRPGETVNRAISFQAPQKPGFYIAEIDLVSNDVSSLQDLGTSPALIPVVVSG